MYSVSVTFSGQENKNEGTIIIIPLVELMLKYCHQCVISRYYNTCTKRDSRTNTPDIFQNLFSEK